MSVNKRVIRALSTNKMKAKRLSLKAQDKTELASSEAGEISLTSLQGESFRRQTDINLHLGDKQELNLCGIGDVMKDGWIP